MKQFKSILSYALMWLVLGALTIPIVGCASTDRGNTVATEAVTIDHESGVPVWVKRFEQWHNEAKTTASKTSLDKIQATETRGADGSTTYALQADGVSTSPEMQIAQRALDLAAARNGFSPPSPSPNLTAEQVVLSRGQYNQLLQGNKDSEGATTNRLDPAILNSQSPEPPLVALTESQFNQLLGRLEDAPKAGSVTSVLGDSSQPSGQFSEAQLEQVREFLLQGTSAETQSLQPEAGPNQPPAPPSTNEG